MEGKHFKKEDGVLSKGSGVSEEEEGQIENGEEEGDE